MRKAAETALVTGGAKRIGKAIVEDLAANGFAVAIHCNRSLLESHTIPIVRAVLGHFKRLSRILAVPRLTNHTLRNCIV